MLIKGTDNNDTLTGSTEDDSIFAYAGNDTINAGQGNDTLDGGTGNDSMYGGVGNDIYIVDSLKDTVVEQPLADFDDAVTVSVNNYILSANVERLTLAGGLTSSALNGTGNNLDNHLEGNEFNNVLSGSGGSDGIIGLGGNDTLNGGSAHDGLAGDLGHDSLNGGTGNDFMVGQQGRDTLTGGTGKDTIRFDDKSDGIDTITDFVVADDVIEVSQYNFGGTVGVLPFNQFRVGTSARDQDDRFIYNRSTGALYFDSDGVGGMAQTHFAKLSPGLAMTNRDIYIGNQGYSI